MKKAEKMSYRFHALRNYYFETHDKDGNITSDIAESEWCDSVISDVVSLRKNSEISEVFYLFDNDGTKGLHAHLVVTFKKPHRRTFAVKLLSGYCTPCDSNWVDYLRNK